MKLGKAFSDNLSTGQRHIARRNDDSDHSWWLGAGRVLFFMTVLSVGMFTLLWRLFDLTVIHGHEHRVLADGNRTRELIRHAPRGILRDRTGKPLVENIPHYRLVKPCSGGQNTSCTSIVTREEGDALSKIGLPPGTFLEVDFRRQYLFSTAISHIIGYTGELSEKDLKDEYYTLRHYNRGDRIGRTGAEAVYEEVLRGRDGKELVEVDAQGRIIRVLGRDREIPGRDVTLSIDAGLQDVVEKNFPEGAKGAVVVSRPATGEILAMFSSPSYNVNEFSSGLSQEEYTALINNPDQPMFNRTIGGVYPPGSTFKIVTAMAALEEGAIKRSTTVEDVGVMKIGPFSFPNWFFLQYGKTDGIVDVVKALERSNDIFFYKTGEWLGITKLIKWAHIVGIGKPLGIELGGEASGLMPSPDWKKSRFSTAADREAKNDRWYVGDTYHISIGQGYLLVTPLQVNFWTNIIANRGAVCRPTIEKAHSKSSPAGRCKEVVVHEDTISLVTEGMKRACEPGGTGWPLFNFAVIPKDAPDRDVKVASASANAVSIPIACKTGTAEFGDPNDRTHAWFTAFAPLPSEALAGEGLPGGKSITGDPEISVTVLVEEKGEGSSVAAPIAKKIFESWFTR